MVSAYAGVVACRGIEYAKWRLWHVRWQGCLIKLARLSRWTEAKSIRDIEGVRLLRRHRHDLIAYLEANRSAPVNYRARCAAGKPISTAFVESASNEIVARRMVRSSKWAEKQEFLASSADLGASSRKWPCLVPRPRSVAFPLVSDLLSVLRFWRAGIESMPLSDVKCRNARHANKLQELCHSRPTNSTAPCLLCDRSAASMSCITASPARTSGRCSR